MVLGDSISAGRGIDAAHGWVRLLAQRLHVRGYAYTVVNASVSGDTTRSGLSRLPAALAEHRPAIVIVELGGNDGLQGLPLSEMRDSLAAIIAKVRQSGAQVLLVGVRMPPNYGPAYTERFHAVYRELAQHYRVSLVPNLLAGIDDRPALMQADGIHPTSAAQARMVDNVWPRLVPLLAPHGSAAPASPRAGTH